MEVDSAPPATNEVPAELLEGAVDISEAKDGGILKVILKEATSDEVPGLGDEVSVHYTGTLTNGTKFDSSRDRGDLFKFKLGQGMVIKAWDQGVATMKKGELCRLICRSEYAYGASGSPPTIPPNATLIFEVELFSWQGEDLSEDHDGGVIRSQVKKGEGYLTPNEGALVDVTLKGSYNGKVFDERTLKYTVGDGDEQGIPDGIDVGLRKFKRQETSILTLSPKYAFGAKGSEQFSIPGDSTVKYEVTLNSLEKAKESYEMDGAEKIEQSELAKAQGAAQFKAGKFEKAVKKYKLIIKWLDGTDEMDEEQKKQRATLLAAAHSNCAMCYLKLNEWSSARTHCDNALEFEAPNEKILFRRGQAFAGLKSWQEAKKDFQAVLAMNSGNKAAKNQLTIADHHAKKELEREKRMYAGMFGQKVVPKEGTPV